MAQLVTVDRVRGAGYEFERAFDVSLLLDEEGSVRLDFPHERYAKKEQSRLVAGGEGPFCQFDCPPGLDDAGVYLICADADVCYVGQTMNGLTDRFGSKGYGRIAPRNCYAGGQPTNVRVNAQILAEHESGRHISVWFLPVPHSDLDLVEDEIKERFSPAWNVR